MKRIQYRQASRFMWRSLALASLLWLGIGQGGAPEPVPIGESAGAETPRKRTAAYVYDRPILTFSDADADNLDQLNFSFALLKKGEVNGDHWQSIGAFKAYIAKHPHILPVLSIGGWGADGFSQAASTEEGRDRFVESTLKLMQKHGFLGVDIDWEYPGSSAAGIASSTKDKQNYTLLLKALREGLDALAREDGRNRMLAIAIGADSSLIKNIDCQAVGAIVDQVNLMTYDLQTPKVASHHTPLYSVSDRYPLSADSAVRAFAAAGIPKSKIMLGAAFYGRVYQLKSATSTPVFAEAKDNGAKSVTYKNILANSRWMHAFDDEAKAPYATDGTTFLTYDNPASIRHKGAYVSQNGLMGLMCWEYGGDANGELLASMRQGLSR